MGYEDRGSWDWERIPQEAASPLQRIEMSAGQRRQLLGSTREAFEAWVTQRRIVVDLTPDGNKGYADNDIDWLWLAFIAGKMFGERK